MHATMARMRAIENGVPLLRPTSSGRSIAVDAYGSILSSVDDFEAQGAPLVAVLPMGSVGTLFARLGDIVTWISLLGSVGLIVLGVVLRLRRPVTAG